MVLLYLEMTTRRWLRTSTTTTDDGVGEKLTRNKGRQIEWTFIFVIFFFSLLSSSLPGLLATCLGYLKGVVHIHVKSINGYSICQANEVGGQWALFTLKTQSIEAPIHPHSHMYCFLVFAIMIIIILLGLDDSYQQQLHICILHLIRRINPILANSI